MDDMDESYFDWSDEDDLLCSSKYISSDEDDFVTFAAPKCSRKGEKVSKTKQKRNDSDDFEKEMASELSQTIQELTSSFGVQESNNASQSSEKDVKKSPEFYDDVYFDSDESDFDETTSQDEAQPRHRRHKVLSNDELFYDPTMDDRDQEWINQRRRSYQPKGSKSNRMMGTKEKNSQLPASDAVLNCPACLTTLCMDCQRHEIYHNQYRAMFVFNCVVDVTEQLSYPSKNQKKKEFLKNKKARKNKRYGLQEENKDVKEKQGNTETAASKTDEVFVTNENTQSINQTIQPSPSSSQDDSLTEKTKSNMNIGTDMYHPVKCKICNTKVAVFDSDEVYHFFNVVTSY